jgi:competence ComEA-like helix-hairpin-helix protein
VRGLVHLAAGLALVALAFALGRWLRDPEPGGPLLLLLLAIGVGGLAARRLYAPGGLGRRRAAAAEPAHVPPPPARPRDDGINLNTASVAELQRVPGIGPVGAARIVDERERGGPYRSVGDLARVTGFGPGRVRGLAGRVRV